MNNQSLAFVISGMINELKQAIDAVASSMPEDAARQQSQLVYYIDKNGNEIAPSGNALFDLSHLAFSQRQVRYVDNPNGDHVALMPLHDLLNDWTNRITLLESVSTEKDNEL